MKRRRFTLAKRRLFKNRFLDKLLKAPNMVLSKVWQGIDFIPNWNTFASIQQNWGFRKHLNAYKYFLNYEKLGGTPYQYMSVWEFVGLHCYEPYQFIAWSSSKLQLKDYLGIWPQHVHCVYVTHTSCHVPGQQCGCSCKAVECDNGHPILQGIFSVERF